MSHDKPGAALTGADQRHCSSWPLALRGRGRQRHERPRPVRGHARRTCQRQRPQLRPGPVPCSQGQARSPWRAAVSPGWIGRGRGLRRGGLFHGGGGNGDGLRGGPPPGRPAAAPLRAPGALRGYAADHRHHGHQRQVHHRGHDLRAPAGRGAGPFGHHRGRAGGPAAGGPLGQRLGGGLGAPRRGGR